MARLGNQPKFIAGWLKAVLLTLGIIITVTALVLIVVGILKFGSDCATDCQNTITHCNDHEYQSDSNYEGSVVMVIIGFVSIFVGPILIAIGASRETRKSYVNRFPYSTVCPKCKSVSDYRYFHVCPNCGTELPPCKAIVNGAADANGQPTEKKPDYGFDNPYEAYCKQKSQAQDAVAPSADVQSDDNHDDSPFDEMK